MSTRTGSDADLPTTPPPLTHPPDTTTVPGLGTPPPPPGLTITGDSPGTQTSGFDFVVHGPAGAQPRLDNLDRSSERLSRLLGMLGMALPPICVTMAFLLPHAGVGPIPRLGSVSAFYYTSAISAFIGILVSMALFLFTYKGYKDEWQEWDNLLSNFAACMALLVAVFPTRPPDGLRPGWWTDPMGKVHVGSAALLFLALAGFCLILFPTKDLRAIKRQSKSRIERIKQYLRGYFSRKRFTHYKLYYVCGVGILACLAWALWAGLTNRSIFLPEWIALWLFGLSWLRKGQVGWTKQLDTLSLSVPSADRALET